MTSGDQGLMKKLERHEIYV